MFTGLIETTTEITNFSKTQNGAIIQINCPFSDEVSLGDSIAINGACLTVIKKDGSKLAFEISTETLNMANFSNLKSGQIVNIERAMKMNARFDGHIVSGHIDGVATIRNITQTGFSYDFEFETKKEITKYIVKKGSVTINGISLTVTRVSDTTFNITVIPHTIENTNLNNAKIGDIVNIETDIFAKYVEKFLSLNNNNSKISMEMLKENGYF